MFKKKIQKLRKSFLRRFLFLIKKEKLSFKLNDIQLNLDIRDSIDREIYFTNRYEEEQIKLLIDSIKKYKITHFVDVGANIGIYALIIAKNFPNIKIDAFEPHKGAFERMKANIHQNGFSPLQLAYLFLFYELAGIFTSTAGSGAGMQQLSALPTITCLRGLHSFQLLTIVFFIYPLIFSPPGS